MCHHTKKKKGFFFLLLVCLVGKAASYKVFAFKLYALAEHIYLEVFSGSVIQSSGIQGVPGKALCLSQDALSDSS